MKQVNLLVQYQGGGYEGCYWEWNFCLVDDKDTPTQFQNIFATGRNGVRSLEDVCGVLEESETLVFDLSDPEEWVRFCSRDRENRVTPHFFVGVSNWLCENREDISYLPICSCCGDTATEYVFGDFHGEGGCSYVSGCLLCVSCATQEFLEEICAELPKDLGGCLDPYTNDDVYAIVKKAMSLNNIHFLVGDCEVSLDQGDWDMLLEYIPANLAFLAHESLCQDDQLQLC